jgi:hypothetical protein
MTFTFKNVKLEGIMELNGSIDFPPGKAIVIYGSNQQGKTNVINAIRYAFLQDIKKQRKPKKEYDDQRLPTRNELVFGGQAKITVSFQNNNVDYILQRSLQSNGRREVSELFRADAPDQKIDVETFLKTRLKVSLLDALFAPEIAQGFKQLYSGDIGNAVAEMFKEITTLREIAEKFIWRLKKLKSAADAQCVLIKTNYTDFCNQLSKSSPSIATLKEFEELKKFEAGKTFKKLDDFHAKIVEVIGKLKGDELTSEISSAIGKAKELDGIRSKLSEQEAIRQKITELKDTLHDHKVLKNWIKSTGNITSVKGKIKSMPKLNDKNRSGKVKAVLMDFSNAKHAYEQAEGLAKEENVKLENIPESIKDLAKLASLLSKNMKTGKEIDASVTKVGGKVYTVLPLKLLAKDSSFSEINPQPIPKGSKEEYKKYLESVTTRIKKLRRVKSLHDESERLFNKFSRGGIQVLNSLVDILDRKGDRIKKDIEDWSSEIASSSSSFIGKNIKAKAISSVNHVNQYAKQIETQTSTMESRFIGKVNNVLRDLSVPVTKLDQHELEKILQQVRLKIKELPQMEMVEDSVGERKIEWQRNDEAYNDFAQIPRIADETIFVLEQILAKCFDETKLRERIVGTYNEILTLMQERRLIQAVAEIQPQELRSVVKYKGKVISHPAGSEKTFYSLAILTALAHYFQTPLLIDEVANNLDSNNLRAFFELVNEFKDRYSVQYVLSIKQTNDFDLDGWVKELRDGTEIHEIKDKNISKIDL